MTIPNSIGEQIALLAREIAELKRREHGRSREGTIVEEDPANGLYRVEFTDGEEPFVGPWMQVEALSSGAMKIQGEPVQGQRVKVTSENGDLTDGVIALSSFSDANSRPKGANGELIITLGENRLELTGGGLSFTGPVQIDGPVTINGSSLTHNGKNVGSDHTHKDVTPGPSPTGPPT